MTAVVVNKYGVAVDKCLTVGKRTEYNVSKIESARGAVLEYQSVSYGLDSIIRIGDLKHNEKYLSLLNSGSFTTYDETYLEEMSKETPTTTYVLLCKCVNTNRILILSDGELDVVDNEEAVCLSPCNINFSGTVDDYFKACSMLNLGCSTSYETWGRKIERVGFEAYEVCDVGDDAWVAIPERCGFYDYGSEFALYMDGFMLSHEDIYNRNSTMAGFMMDTVDLKGNFIFYLEQHSCPKSLKMDMSLSTNKLPWYVTDFLVNSQGGRSSSLIAYNGKRWYKVLDTTEQYTVTFNRERKLSLAVVLDRPVKVI